MSATNRFGDRVDLNSKQKRDEENDEGAKAVGGWRMEGER